MGLDDIDDMNLGKKKKKKNKNKGDDIPQEDENSKAKNLLAMG